MIALNQVAGLGIRHRTHRMLAWVVGAVLVALLTAVSITLGALGYIALLGFTLWRLTGR